MHFLQYPARLTVAALAVALVACSGQPSTSSPQTVEVAVSPDQVSLGVGQQQAFDATVTGTADTSVTWSVQEGAAGGGVTTAGLYTAPGTAGTYHVVATSAVDTTKTAVATITVTAAPVVAISISPRNASLTTGGTRTFTATVTGSTDTAVIYAVQEAGGGTITGAGVYTAPATPGTYHVVATSHADGTKVASATVTVTAAPVVAIGLSPTSAALNGCQTATLTATVTGTTNTAVTYAVQEGSTGGSVTSGGVYTAPSTAGTYHVIATSQADTSKTATATFTVTTKVLGVAVSPATLSLAPGQTGQFTATVTTTCGSTTATQVVTAPL